MNEKTLKDEAKELQNDNRTITLTRKDFITKSMDALLNDDSFKNNAMMFMFGTAIIATLTDKLFEETKETGDA